MTQTDRGFIFDSEDTAIAKAAELNGSDCMCPWQVGRRDGGFAVYRTEDGFIWTGAVDAAENSRQIILSEDGRHVLVGGYSVGPASSELTAQGLSGWVATAAGEYYGLGKMTLAVQSTIGAPRIAFSAAVAKFEQIRRRTLGE